MVKLVGMVSHPELVAEIVGQFMFMKMMSKPEDNSFKTLLELDLNDVGMKADSFFIDFCDFDELISDTESVDLTSKLTEFLSQWKNVTDVTAIQQNIHYRLSILENK